MLYNLVGDLRRTQYNGFDSSLNVLTSVKFRKSLSNVRIILLFDTPIEIFVSLKVYIKSMFILYFPLIQGWQEFGPIGVEGSGTENVRC